MKKRIYEEKTNKLKELLKNQGILIKGFGLVYKGVFQSEKLTIKAKGLYAYLCVFAGNGNKCFPSIKKICSYLDITEITFRKYLRELVSKGLT